ncbi:hypothetical protein EMPS_07609 [Entomortierella parvispora]|uniref:Uncharacterized protein n=1 Tax=Entomortierella parvispora TaxID=205924 RepID=A0A9P3LYB2_9FUNG|nr:hypothetical protein EMPS_07609 [Entomortierella parvispora]
MSSDMNICLRFCLGNTDLSHAKGLYQIMEDHAVVAWTDLHVVGLYGRPADVVEATINSFYLHPRSSSVSSTLCAPSPHPDPLSSPLATATPTASLAAVTSPHSPPLPRAPSIETMSLEQLQIKEAQSLPGEGEEKETLPHSSSSSLSFPARFMDATSAGGSSQTGKDGEDKDKEKSKGPAGMCDSPSSPSHNYPSRTMVPPDKWNTDDDLWTQKYPSSSDLKQYIHGRRGSSSSSSSGGTGREPPFQIWIALPENIRLYLLLVSGAFTSYLLEEKTVGACYARGGDMEELLEARDRAEMKVSDSREHNMTVVETRDLEALRRILSRVATAMATEPVKEYTEKWMKELYAKDIEEWDQTLKLYREAHEDTMCWVTGDQGQQVNEEPWIEDNQDKKKEGEGTHENKLQDLWTWTEYESLERHTGKAKKKQR